MKNKSSSFTVVLSGTVSLLVVLLVLSVHQASASSCFTDTGGHWAETFICWLKANGLSSGYVDGTFRPDNNITRAEVASLLYHYSTSGTITVNSSTDWFPYFTGDTPTPSLFGTTIKPGSAGSFVYVSHMVVISAQHQQQMNLQGVVLCYDATSLEASITGVDVWLIGSGGFVYAHQTIATSLSDANCHTYSFSAPYPLVIPEETLSLELHITTTGIFGTVAIASETAIEGYTTSLLGSPPVMPQAGPNSNPLANPITKP